MVSWRGVFVLDLPGTMSSRHPPKPLTPARTLTLAWTAFVEAVQADAFDPIAAGKLLDEHPEFLIGPPKHLCDRRTKVRTLDIYNQPLFAVVFAWLWERAQSQPQVLGGDGHPLVNDMVWDAARRGATENLRLLVMHLEGLGQRPLRERDAQDGDTPIHLALLYGHLSTVAWMINHDPGLIDLSNPAGETLEESARSFESRDPFTPPEAFEQCEAILMAARARSVLMQGASNDATTRRQSPDRPPIQDLRTP